MINKSKYQQFFELLKKLDWSLIDERAICRSDFLSPESASLLLSNKKLRYRILVALEDDKDSFDKLLKELAKKSPSLYQDIQWIKVKIDSTIDNDKLDNFLNQIVHILNSNVRKQMIQELYKDSFNRWFEFFYNLVYALWCADFSEKICKIFWSDNLDADHLHLVLIFKDEFFKCAISFMQSEENKDMYEKFIKFVANKNWDSDSIDLKTMHLNLNWAWIPELAPDIEKFTEQAIKHWDFMTLVKLFKKISWEVFWDDYEAFFTNGTRLSYALLESRFWKMFPNSHVIMNSFEYLPMYYLSDESKRHVVDIKSKFWDTINDINFTEEELMDAMFTKARGLNIYNYANTPIPLLISSEPRIWWRPPLDIDKITELVKKENEKIWYKKYHLWIDASQEARTFNWPDIVFYSKRFWWTNWWITIVNKETYPDHSQKDETEDIREAFRIRSWFDSKFISRCIWSLMTYQWRVLHTISDLTKLPNLWRFKWKWTFLKEQIQETEEFINASWIWKYFTIFHGESNNEKDFKVQKLIRLVPTEKWKAFLKEKKLTLNEIERRFSKKNVDSQTFSLVENDRFYKLINLANEEPFNRMRFIEKVLRFQDRFKDHIVVTLLPADLEKLSDSDLIKNFYASVEKHEYFRLFFNVSHPKRFLVEFFRRFKELLDE